MEILGFGGGQDTLFGQIHMDDFFVAKVSGRRSRDFTPRVQNLRVGKKLDKSDLMGLNR